MKKRFLVVLDDSNNTDSLKRFAFDYAKECPALLSGAAIIDIPWITAVEPEPLGGAAFKVQRDLEVISQLRTQITRILAEFHAECAQHQIKDETYEIEGGVGFEVAEMAKSHDLILMGQTGNFHNDFDTSTNNALRYVLQYTPRPVMVVPPHLPKEGAIVNSQEVLIAYDNSMQSARALHLFLLLKMHLDRPVRLVSVAPTQAEAAKALRNAIIMCKSHGVQPALSTIETPQQPSYIIQELAQKHKAGLLVMGAFGHSGLRDFFFGSTTSELLENTDVPLFIYH